MNNYIDVIYDQSTRPLTRYPSQLCAYLVQRFSLSKGSVILDAGCGRGDFAKGFHDLGLRPHGLDCRQTTQHVLADIPVQYADMEQAPFPWADGMFDAVFAKSVIEHFDNPEHFMQECYRVLKPGGRIILMVPDWISCMKIYFDDYTHRQPYTVPAVRDLLKIFQFKEISSELFYQLPLIWKYPSLKLGSWLFRQLMPVTRPSPFAFVRWSVELMVLGTGVK